MIKKIFNHIKNFCYNRVAHNPELTRLLIHKNRDYVIDELFKYPSFINNGHLHFEKLFKIAEDYKLNNESGLILDVGGADGVTAIMFNNAFKNANVHVFEPLDDNIPVLKKNIQPYSRIKLFKMALGSEKKQTKINITHRVTSSSLLNVNKSELKDDYISTQLAPEREQAIEVNTIDNMVEASQKVLVLKMDVQGFELEVLKGAKNTLKNTCLVMAEFQNHKLYEGAPMYYDLDKFLIENNFTLMQFIPSLSEKHKQMEWDAIYINNSLIK